MQCPYCSAQDTKVVDSRLVGEGHQVRRRRECISCQYRFTTYEKVELSFPRLVKSDGRYVQFKEEKLRQGMLKALEKRPVPTEKLDAAISRILNKVQGSGERELQTKVLGSWVMDELRELDEVAYVRFASVYRRFQALSEFQDEIKKLEQKDKQVAD